MIAAVTLEMDFDSGDVKHQKAAETIYACKISKCTCLGYNVYNITGYKRVR